MYDIEIAPNILNFVIVFVFFARLVQGVRVIKRLIQGRHDKQQAIA
jgi:hypothetical protein